MDFKNLKIAFAFTGSFCTHKKALTQLEELVNLGADVTAVLSDSVLNMNTRFHTAEAFAEKIEYLSGGEIIKTIPKAEEIITKGDFDILTVCPCTGNTLAKIASSVTDTAVTMAVKAQLRNRKPVVLAVATNDGLAGSLANIAKLIERKNIFLVPFGQDDFVKKPSSLVCDFNLLQSTLISALEGFQLQPVLLQK